MSDFNILLEDFYHILQEYDKDLEMAGQIWSELTESLETESAERRSKRKMQTDPFFLERSTKGYFAVTFPDIWKDPQRFRRHFRMERETFEYILEGIRGKIEKSGERAICPEERLVLTLRFLIHGGSYFSLVDVFRIHDTTIGMIVHETLEAIWSTFKDVHMKLPNKQELKASAEKFYLETGFPHVPLLLDGKHFPMTNPAGAGNTYWNRKGFYSVNLQAIVDSSYRFIVVESAAFGKQADGGVFAASNFKKLLDKVDNFSDFLPDPETLPRSDVIAPFVVLADSAYPLRPDMLKPYPGDYYDLSQEKRNFNKRLASTRRTIECAFGQLVAQFRVFRSSLEVNSETASLAIATCCLLHNIFIDKEDRHNAILRQRIYESMEKKVQEKEESSTKSEETNSAVRFDKNEVRELFSKYLYWSKQCYNDNDD